MQRARTPAKERAALIAVGRWRGPCDVCGGADARHRIVHAIRRRHSKGETMRHLATEYGLTVTSVRDIVA